MENELIFGFMSRDAVLWFCLAMFVFMCGFIAFIFATLPISDNDNLKETKQ